MNLDAFCLQLEKDLLSRDTGDQRIAVAAGALAKLFRLKSDEVAFLRYDPKFEGLSFVWPEHLKKAGSVPVSSNQALAARAYREKKGLVNNRFSSASHSFVFESVPPVKGQRPLPIQKIMSMPIAGSEDFQGVIQVCRKGEDPASAGADFSRDDLVAFARIVLTLAKGL